MSADLSARKTVVSRFAPASPGFLSEIAGRTPASFFSFVLGLAGLAPGLPRLEPCPDGGPSASAQRR